MDTKVYIVFTGSRYEGGEVDSVHVSRESALARVERLIAEHDVELKEFRKNSDDNYWQSTDHEFVKCQNEDAWKTRSKVINIDEHLVVDLSDSAKG